MSTETLDDLMRSNVIDSRDLVERAAEIEGELPEADEETPDTAAYFAELHEELDAINEIIGHINGYSGDQAKDGVTLVADNYWIEYAQELAEDIGAIQKGLGWPMDYIDWKAAADALQMDYTSVQIGSEEYWFR